MGTEDEDIDAHLAMVLDEVITAIQTTKQAVWSASNSDVRHALIELKRFLSEQAVALFDTTVDDGPADSVVSPAGRKPRNLRADAGQDRAVFRTLVLGELEAVAADVRSRAAALSGSSHGEMLVALADGLEYRLEALVRAVDRTD